MFGRVLAVEGSGYDPAPYADCYLSKARPQPSEPPIDQIFKSQVKNYFRPICVQPAVGVVLLPWLLAEPWQLRN